MKKVSHVVFLFLTFTLCQVKIGACFERASSSCQSTDYPVVIPLAGNGWVINNGQSKEGVITPQGVQNWTKAEEVVRIYFHVTQKGILQIALNARVSKGRSSLRVVFNGESKNIDVSTTEYGLVPVGQFEVKEVGYQWVEIHGLKKQGENYADMSELLLGGTVTQGKIHFVRDDFYWGRRGPSVHLNYLLPPDTGDVLYFYNEMTIPEGNDVLGSYFMANGFGQGYFGIQVNSETERRVLFSVWSPFKTDDPRSIPDEQKIVMLKKGSQVHAGEFGNEGSGGQSYLKYNWKAGVTYRFLLKGEPASNNSTDFTAWFYAPEKGAWMLIASFRRPQTATYLTRLHSFLENFIPEQGLFSREVHYSNQWVYTVEKKWIELKNASFSADATARKEARVDYAGGSKASYFFLRNCGFFDETTTIGSSWERIGKSDAPVIDWSKLP